MGGLWRRRWPAIAVAVAAAIAAAPVWLAALPAMPDLPAHLAGFFLLAGGIHDPQLATYYKVAWQFVPNLASEIAVPFLARLTGLVPATKIFIGATIALWIVGPAAIQRAMTGRIGVTSLFAGFFAYNANFFWGFLNYDFSVGLDFLLFAAWIAAERAPLWPRIAVFSVALILVYFCHVFGAAILLMLVGVYEFDRLLRTQALFTKHAASVIGGLGLAALPVVAAFVFFKPTAADGSRLEFNLLSTWDDRIGSALEYRFDQPAYVALGLLAALWLFGLWRGWFRIQPSARLVLVALALCVAFMPEWAMGGWGLDLRTPPILGALAFAAAEDRLSPRLRLRLGLAAAGIIAFAFAAAAVAGNWQYYDRQYAEFRNALSTSPPGVKLMTVLDGDAMGLASDEPYWHIAEFAIIDRHGFSPLLFTTAGQHVVHVRKPFRSIAAATAQQGSPPDVGELGDLAANQIDGDTDIRDVFPYLMLFQCHYDEVVVIRSGGRPSPVPSLLHLRHRGSFFDLYDVRQDDACADR